MIILAVDLGKARTGLAVCDKSEILASPAGVLEIYDRTKLCARICEVAAERRAERIVVGLPKNMDGSEGESALSAREFADMLREASGLPVFMSDERGTTITAHQYLNITDTRGKKRKAVVDTVAATIILEDYLQYRRNHPEEEQ